MKKRLLVTLMFALIALFAVACSDDDGNDGANAETPSDEDACANYDNVCSGNAEAVNCLASIEYFDDCQKKCMGYGGDCLEIIDCLNTDSGDLYDQYCTSETPTSGDKLPENSCMSSYCSSDYDGCNDNPECVKLHYCVVECENCDDCDYTDCEDSCSNNFRTGTAGYGYLLQCGADNGCSF